jgi:predicted PurR-regulated permease PerM
MFGTDKVAAADWSIRNTMVWGIALVLAGIVLWLVHSELLMVLLATLLAISLRGAAERVAQHSPLSTRWALALISLVILLLIVGFCVWVGPQLAQQGQDLVKNLIKEGSQLKDKYGQTSWGRAILEQASSGGGADPKAIAAQAGKAAGASIEGIASLLVLIVTTLYFATNPDLYTKGLVKLAGKPHRERLREVMGKVAHAWRWWFMGQLIDMLVVGVLTTIGLMLVGMPLALALGVLAGLLTFVPYFGAILAAVPAVAIAAGSGLHMVVMTLVVFGVCHLVEGYLVSPMVQDRMVKLPPALLILSMTFMGTIFGPMGIIMASPLAAAALVLVSELYVVDVLGDESGRDVTTRK